MNYTKQIKEHLERYGGIITTSYCRENMIPTVYLSRMVHEGVLNRVSKGIYLFKNGDYDEFYFFQYRYKKAIFSYETALYLLKVTDKIIQTMDVTVSANYKFNKTIPGISVHYVKKAWLDLGVVEGKTMFGNIVWVYSYERTICDFILHKNEMDIEVYIKLLRSYTSYENKDVHKLYDIATKMGIANEVREIMEVIA